MRYANALNDRQAEHFSQNLNKNGHDAEASIDMRLSSPHQQKMERVFQQPFGDKRASKMRYG